MNSPCRFLSFGHVFLLCVFFAAPARALVLISETRSVTASYYGSGIETISSAGTFGPFSATAIGIPFGGGSVSASQVSNITSTRIEVTHHVNDFYGPGGWAASNFEVRFSLPHETRIIISGYSAYFSGPATLVSESLGAIPLIWGPDNFYRNHLEFDQVLDSGVYTFTSNEWIRGDGISTRLVLREAVSDSGPGVGMLLIGLLSLAARRRRLSQT